MSLSFNEKDRRRRHYEASYRALEYARGLVAALWNQKDEETVRHYYALTGTYLFEMEKFASTNKEVPA